MTAGQRWSVSGEVGLERRTVAGPDRSVAPGHPLRLPTAPSSRARPCRRLRPAVLHAKTQGAQGGLIAADQEDRVLGADH